MRSVAQLRARITELEAVRAELIRAGRSHLVGVVDDLLREENAALTRAAGAPVDPALEAAVDGVLFAEEVEVGRAEPGRPAGGRATRRGPGGPELAPASSAAAARERSSARAPTGETAR